MWIQRVQTELNELCLKITDLETFLKSEESGKLSIDMLSLMDLQLQSMRSYRNLLKARLSLAEKENNCDGCYTDAESVFC